VSFRVVVSPVTDREGGSCEFPGSLVVTVISRMCLAEDCDRGSRFGQVLTALIKGLSLRDLVGCHLRICATRAGRSFRSSVIARHATENQRDKRRSDHRRSKNFLLFSRIYHQLT